MVQGIHLTIKGLHQWHFKLLWEGVIRHVWFERRVSPPNKIIHSLKSLCLDGVEDVT